MQPRTPSSCPKSREKAYLQVNLSQTGYLLRNTTQNLIGANLDGAVHSLPRLPLLPHPAFLSGDSFYLQARLVWSGEIPILPWQHNG